MRMQDKNIFNNSNNIISINNYNNNSSKKQNKLKSLNILKIMFHTQAKSNCKSPIKIIHHNNQYKASKLNLNKVRNRHR